MRRAIVWVVVLLLVLGGGYLGDNMLRGYAENRVADAISAELGEAAGAPSVGLGGFPFALSLVTRSVPTARLAVDELPLEISGQEVVLSDVVADTGEIRLGSQAVNIASLTGSARLSYRDLARVADVPVRYAGQGRLELRYSREFFGRQVAFAVSALPELDVDGQVIRLSDPKLELAGNAIDINLSQDQLDAIIEPITVTLDHDLRLTSLVPDDGGIAIGVGGTNLSVPIPG